MVSYTDRIKDRRLMLQILEEFDGNDDCIENDGECIQSGRWDGKHVLIHYTMIDDDELINAIDNDVYREHICQVDVEYEDVEDTASALAGAGWTSEDHDLLLSNFNICDGLATVICEELRKIEERRGQ